MYKEYRKYLFLRVGRHPEQMGWEWVDERELKSKSTEDIE